MDDLIREMEAMSERELYEQFMRERPKFLYYEGPLSLQENGSFWGIRLDGVGPDGNVPEDCLFLNDLLAQKFYIRPGEWSEAASNRFRIMVERLDWGNG